MNAENKKVKKYAQGYIAMKSWIRECAGPPKENPLFSGNRLSGWVSDVTVISGW